MRVESTVDQPVRVENAVPADRERTLARAAGAALFLLAAQFLVVLGIAPGIAPAYDVRGGAISDLGAIAETAALFNLSLLAVGVLNIVGGGLLHRIHRRTGVLAIWLVAGIGAAGAGVFPLGGGGPHGLFALVAFLGFNLQALATASVVRGPMRLVSVLAGGVGLLFVVLMILGDGGNAAAFGPIGHGGTERMIVYPCMVWLLALSGLLMGDHVVAARR